MVQPLWKIVWQFLINIPLPYDPSVPLVGIYQKRNPLIQKELTNVHCCCSVTQLCPILGNPMDCSKPGISISWSLFKHMSIESMMPSSHFILCCLLLVLLSIFRNIRVFSNASTLHIRWPRYWNFSISPSNKYSGLISFKIDWFDLAVQGTVKSLLQNHNLKASILQTSAFFMVQFSHPYMITGKKHSFDYADLLKIDIYAF